MKRIHIVLTAIIVVLALGLGWFFGQKSMQLDMSESTSNGVSDKSIIKAVNGVIQDGSGKAVKYWYDPMVPERRFDKPGKSPFMDMQLVPKYTNAGSDGEEGGVAISSQTRQNLGIRLAQVESKRFGESFSAIGRIEPDQRRFYDVQTRIPGFVERLLVRAVGDSVSKGQKVAEIYAPELLAAQQEYLALRQLSSVDGDGVLRDASRNRLKLLGMSRGEIAAITMSGKSRTRFGVYAPASGVLTELGVREGGQLMAGSSLIQIADLSQVWLIAEVPERDVARLKLGVAVDVQLQSFPGEVLKGKVDHLHPTLVDASRTLRVRIELPNKGNRLHPGMYANVEFSGQAREALSVPTESVIATGTRKVVIVKSETGYRPVEVTTGQERDRYTEVLNGLAEGEEVVVSGQFLIDSEASLSGVLTRLSQQDKAMDHDMGEMHDMAKHQDHVMPSEKMIKGRGKVIDLNVKTKDVTLSHEPIEALGWPSMTMGFKVKDSKQLSKLKAGDEVEFDLKSEASADPDMPAQYMIDRIEKPAIMKGDMKGVNP
jgi:Cu(I)/Ag(I) efflux system membrane fusion protein|tara:strand:- start:4540 stop:6168 length:1629 start_codon:yes stop_codon:yes gene_type:complete